MQVDFHPDATAEFESSADWYAERSLSSVRNFLVAVDLGVAEISKDPHRFLWVDKRHQACSVAKFPFQIVFRHDNDHIYIVAIAHAKRRPGYWKKR